MATALVDLYGSQPVPFDRIIVAEGYRPTERDDFMCDLHRAYFLKKLREWKRKDRRRIARHHGAAASRLAARARRR